MQVQRSLRLFSQFRNASQQRLRQIHGFKSATRDHEDISIDVPWGQIAGKWYGPRDVRPILAMHGWMDNAGTFDTLAPLLPPHLPLLAIDVPGHGLSSWLPRGAVYHSIELVQIVLRIMKHYNWEKVSLMGHSMSSINGFVFCSLFPDKVDIFIGLDGLKPLIRTSKKCIDNYALHLEDILKLEDRMLDGTEPPSFAMDKLMERLHLGTRKSISMESCKYLLQRSCIASSKDPDKYYLSRDNRLKDSIVYTVPNETVLEMATRIKAPYLFVKFLQAPYFEEKKYFYETLEILRKNPRFEYYEVEGLHHVHLNEPEKVSPLINAFLKKYRPDA